MACKPEKKMAEKKKGEKVTKCAEGYCGPKKKDGSKANPNKD